MSGQELLAQSRVQSVRGDSEMREQGPGKARVVAVSVQIYDWAGVGISTPLQRERRGRGCRGPGWHLEELAGNRRVEAAVLAWGGADGTWGRWLVGAQSSARCRWSQGEAGSWRGIWLSCWRSMRVVGTRVQ